METPWGQSQAYNLHDSINTDFLDEDIQPVSGRQRHLIFDGIDARDGLTNYQSTQTVESSNVYTYYTKSGKKISIRQDGINSLALNVAWRYNVLVDGVTVGKIGQRSVLDRWQVPGDNYDVAITATGTILAIGKDGMLYEYDQTTHALINSKQAHNYANIIGGSYAWVLICRGPATTYASYVLIFGNISGAATVLATDGTNNGTIYAGTYPEVIGAYNGWAWRNSNSANTNLIMFCPNGAFASCYYGTLTAAAWTALTANANYGIPAVGFTGPGTWQHMIMGAVSAIEVMRTISISDAALVSNVATNFATPGTAAYTVKNKYVGPGFNATVWGSNDASPNGLHMGYLHAPAVADDMVKGANTETQFACDTMTAIPAASSLSTWGKRYNIVTTLGQNVSFNLADYGDSLTAYQSGNPGQEFRGQNGQAMIDYGDNIALYSPHWHQFGTAPNYRLSTNYYNLFAWKREDGIFGIIKAGNANPANLPVSSFIKEIAPDVVSFECDTNMGIYDCVKKQWYMKGQHHGFVAMWPNATTSGQTIKMQRISDYEETVDSGTRLMGTTLALAASEFARTPWDIRDADFFINDSYQRTATVPAVSFALPSSPLINLAKGTQSVSSTYTPLAIRQRDNDISAEWFSNTQLTVVPKDGYFSENIILGSFQVFNINGQTYFYDGSGISQVFLNGLLFSAKQVINNTKNLRLLAVSREIAFFISDFDSQLFAFDGSRSLNPVDGFLSFGTIREAWYTSNDDTLWLTDGSKLITWREGRWGAISYTNAAGSLMMDTSAGSYIVKEDGQTVNTWSLLTGTIQPMTLKTPFVGLGENQRMKVHQYSIYLKFDTIANTNITLTYRYILENGINAATPVTFNVLSTMMDANGYVRLWYIPPVDTVIGASLELTCASKYWIIELVSYLSAEAVSIPVQAQIIA